MFKAAVRFMIRRSVAALNNGDIGPLMSSYSKDVSFDFPGSNRWSGTYRGKEEVAGFLRSFIASRLKSNITDILVNGAPWNARVVIVATDEATDPDGKVCYSNRYTIYGKTRWGKIHTYEVYEDTVKANAFDEHLTARERAGA